MVYVLLVCSVPRVQHICSYVVLHLLSCSLSSRGDGRHSGIRVTFPLHSRFLSRRDHSKSHHRGLCGGDEAPKKGLVLVQYGKFIFKKPCCSFLPYLVARPPRVLLQPITPTLRTNRIHATTLAIAFSSRAKRRPPAAAKCACNAT